MMPLIPPPAGDIGAITFPRQLQKWLDCNPITALTRTQAYITVPSFSVTNIDWLGYSDIVAAFNYEGPNSFSLSGLSQIPVSPDYLAALSWRDGNGHIYRYCLWQNVGEVFLFPVPLYTGQVIMKNFRIEIWSTGTTASQSSNIQLYTSVLGGVDYRWGTDFNLVNSDSIVTNFSYGINPVEDLLPVETPSLGTFGGWLRADTGVSNQSWTVKSVGAGYFTTNFAAGGTIQTTVDTSIKSQTVVTQPLPISADASGAFDPVDVWILFKYNGDGTILTILGKSVLSITSGILYSDGISLSNTPLNTGNWYIVEWWYEGGNVQCNIWPLDSVPATKNYTSNIAGNDRTGGSLFVIGGLTGSASIYISDIIVYNSILESADQQTNLNYFQDRYMNVFNLPFIWPTGSYSVANTPQFNLLENNNNVNPNNLIAWLSGSGGVLGAG